MATKIQIRRGRQSETSVNNPLLLEGEMGIITDALHDGVKVKIGDGITLWNDLPYFNAGSATWGNISGTLSNQTDLQSALDLKINISDFNTYFDSSFSGKTTTDLTEGGNLYFTNSRSINSFLTGYVSSPGIVSSSDSILSAIEKLNGNTDNISTSLSGYLKTDGSNSMLGNISFANDGIGSTWSSGSYIKDTSGNIDIQGQGTNLYGNGFVQIVSSSGNVSVFSGTGSDIDLTSGGGINITANSNLKLNSPNLSVSTIVYLDASKNLVSLANSAGVLTNDGSGNLTWTAGVSTFSDSAFRIQDNGDATKQLAFEVSGISTGTTRTLTVPNVNDTIAVLGTAQTFTAKQTFITATTEMLSASLLDTTYKVALDVPSANNLRLGGGFTGLLIPIATTINNGILTLSGTTGLSISGSITLTGGSRDIQNTGGSINFISTGSLSMRSSVVFQTTNPIVSAVTLDHTSSNWNTSFNYSSGAGNIYLSNYTNSITQTGTASGNITFINIAPSSLTNLASVYAVRSQILSGTNRWNIHADGTAANLFGGTTYHVNISAGSNRADSAQIYATDITAGNSAIHAQTETGDVVKLYSISGWGTPSGILTRTTFDPSTVTLSQLAERVAALITDLKTGHQLLKS